MHQAYKPRPPNHKVWNPVTFLLLSGLLLGASPIQVKEPEDVWQDFSQAEELNSPETTKMIERSTLEVSTPKETIRLSGQEARQAWSEYLEERKGRGEKIHHGQETWEKRGNMAKLKTLRTSELPNGVFSTSPAEVLFSDEPGKDSEILRLAFSTTSPSLSRSFREEIWIGQEKLSLAQTTWAKTPGGFWKVFLRPQESLEDWAMLVSVIRSPSSPTRQETIQNWWEAAQKTGSSFQILPPSGPGEDCVLYESVQEGEKLLILSKIKDLPQGGTSNVNLAWKPSKEKGSPESFLPELRKINLPH
jgi:hypothetical protein